MQNIEGFDKTKLKHAETTEKQALPDTAGKKNSLKSKKKGKMDICL